MSTEKSSESAPVHAVVMPCPECIADAPTEVLDAAKEIARAALNTIRNIIAEEFPATDMETQKDFVKAICQIMAELA
jgi:hypothetical protein